MINLYTNGQNFSNNYMESIPEIKITMVEDDIGLQNLNTPLGESRFSLDTVEPVERFTLDTNTLQKSNKMYYILSISGILIAGTIITIVTLLTK